MEIPLTGILPDANADTGVIMLSQTEKDIWAACNEIAEMLLQKNRAYGDSALNPVRIFSKASCIEQLNVRMDDKLSRMLRGDVTAFGEDVEKDLIGYLILKQVALMRAQRATPASGPG